MTLEPRRYAIANQKGGVGKTTVTLGIASAASAAGIRTLVIDLDPQGNATAGLGIDTSQLELTVNDVLHSDARGVATQAITASAWAHVDAIPADLSLAQRDSDQQLGAEMRLRKALDTPDLDTYELILIDCQPSVGKLVSNALIAATDVLIVTEPSIDSSGGVRNIMASIETVREHYNPELRIAGIILNNVPARGREAGFRANELATAVGDDLWEPHIPARLILSESRGACEPIHSFGSRAADLTAVFDAYLSRLIPAKV